MSITNTSSVNMNQFRQKRLVGELDLTTNPNPSVMTVRPDYFLAETDDSPYLFGEGVKLVDLGANDSEGPPVVTKREEDNDEIFGVRVFSTKQGQGSPYRPIEIAFKGAVIWMEASAALERGAQVSLVQAEPGQVQAVGDFAYFGVALDKASDEGDLVRVMIMADGITEGTAT